MQCFVAAALLALAMPCAAQSSASYFNTVDSDGDGRISLAEYQQRMSWAFTQMDADRNGVLASHEQLVPNAPSLTLAEHHARLAEQYRRQDKNHDGWLSAREFLAPPG